MKRSTINEIMAEADEMIRRHGFALPPFSYWTPDQFRARANDARHVIYARCGWDITDFGAGTFDEMGLFLFTLRNGLLGDLQRGGGMCYAEKLLISRRDQLSPMHTHVIKAEDIINRGMGVSHKCSPLETRPSSEAPSTRLYNWNFHQPRAPCTRY